MSNLKKLSELIRRVMKFWWC